MIKFIFPNICGSNVCQLQTSLTPNCSVKSSLFIISHKVYSSVNVYGVFSVLIIIGPAYTMWGQQKMTQGFPYLTGNLHAQKPNKAHTNQANTTDIQYFYGGCSCLHTHQQEWCKLLLLSLILSILHFLTICANFPFLLFHFHPQSMLPPLVWQGMRVNPQ